MPQLALGNRANSQADLPQKGSDDNQNDKQFACVLNNFHNGAPKKMKLNSKNRQILLSIDRS
jgi:hypothetical protein